MARRYIRPRLTDQAGNVLEGALLRVLEAGTSTTVDLYAASAGGSVLSQPRTTDARGEVEVWLVDGTGDIDLEWSADLGVTTVAASGRTTTFSTFTEFVEAPSEGVTTHAALPDLATSGHPASIISGLGGAALLDVGTGAGTVAAGDDSRITGAVPKSLIDAAGDLIYGSAADTVARLPAGSDGQVLTLASGLPSWAAGASAPLTLTSTATSMIPLTVKGAAGQTANLQEWQDSAGTVLSRVKSDGSVYAVDRVSFHSNVAVKTHTITAYYGLTYNTHDGGGHYFTSTSQTEPIMRITNSAAAQQVLLVRGAAAQTANLQEWQDSAGVVLASVSAAGLHKWASGNEQTTVGAAGAASALPASPTKYLKVVGSDGTAYVVPAFLAA